MGQCLRYIIQKAVRVNRPRYPYHTLRDLAEVDGIGLSPDAHIVD